MKAALLFCIALCLAVCGFAQVKKQRLIAIAELEGFDTLGGGTVLHLIDSVRFTYSGSRHSSFDYNSMDYGDLGTMYENKSSLLDKINGIVIPNNLDSFENSLSIAFDSMYYFGLGGPDSPTQVGVIHYYFDGSVMDAYNSSIYGGSVQFVKYFGRLTFANYSSPYYGINRRFFGYDYEGNVVIDSTGNGLVKKYVFDSLGRYITYTGRDIRIYSYLPDGRVQTRQINDVVDSIFYTPGISGLTGVHSYRYINGVLDTQRIFTHLTHINALGQKDTLLDIASDDTAFTYLTYNNEGNPSMKITRSFTFQYGGTLFRDRVVKYYYYEDYYPSLSIEEQKHSSPISLSPNPFSSSLTLHYSQLLAETPLTIRISDMMGRVAYQATFIPGNGSDNVALPGDIAPGMYSIVVSSAGNPTFVKGIFQKL